VTSTHRTAMDAWEEACRKIPDAKKIWQESTFPKGYGRGIEDAEPDLQLLLMCNYCYSVYHPRCACVCLKKNALVIL
jgi:hypothetical protein